MSCKYISIVKNITRKIYNYWHHVVLLYLYLNLTVKPVDHLDKRIRMKIRPNYYCVSFRGLADTWHRLQSLTTDLLTLTSIEMVSYRPCDDLYIIQATQIISDCNMISTMRYSVNICHVQLHICHVQLHICHVQLHICHVQLHMLYVLVQRE